MNELRTSFWLPRSTIKIDLSTNQKLKSLWTPTGIGYVNASTTLPINIKSKENIYEEVKSSNPEKSGINLKFYQAWRYGKALIGFYKTGVTNVWGNYQKLRTIKSNLDIVNQVNNKGATLDIQMPGFTKLTHIMSQAIYINRIENQSYNDNVKSDIVKYDTTPIQISPQLFNLSRQQYQILKRTPKDFFKLPVFGVLLMIFMEFTPVLCYAIPEITPSTCVLPSIAPRLWNAANNQNVTQQAKLELQQDQLAAIASKTAYNLSLDQVRHLCKALRLVNKYIPIRLYAESVLRDRLQHHYNYLSVDDYYLSGLNGNGNIWDLTYQELVMACLERNLILDIKDTKESSEIIENLRLKLFRFLMDFPNYNIGYLTLTECIEPINTKDFNRYK